MKKFVLAAALSVAATSVFAGGLAEPVMEPEVVEAATSSSAGGFIVPLLLLIVIAAAASN
jgi:C4-dicarboxylate transporter